MYTSKSRKTWPDPRGKLEIGDLNEPLIFRKTEAYKTVLVAIVNPLLAAKFARVSNIQVQLSETLCVNILDHLRAEEQAHQLSHVQTCTSACVRTWSRCHAHDATNEFVNRLSPA